MLNFNNSIITIHDFPATRTYISLRDNQNKILFKTAIKKAGSQESLAKLIKSNLDYPKINQSTISNMLKNKFFRLDLILWLIKYAKFNINLEKEIAQIKGEKTSKPLSPKLPIQLDTNLATLLANLYCDGFCSNLNSHSTGYVNKNNILISKFKRSLYSVFGKVPIYERFSNKTNVTSLRIPTYLGRLIYEKFNFYKDNIPVQIKSSSDEIKGAYLKAVFDDESTISKNYGQIRLKMKYRSYIRDVKLLVESLKIDCSDISLERANTKRFGGDCYYFTINGQYNLKSFKEKIGFDHSRKSVILKKAISKIKVNTYGYKASKIMLNKLRDVGPKTSLQLAYLLNRDKRTVSYHLKNLLKINAVTFKKVWKRYSYEYLWIAKNDNRTNYCRKTEFGQKDS